jgi:hypothetical protein
VDTNRLDDDPLTQEEEDALDRAEECLKHYAAIPDEEVLAEFGLNAETVAAMLQAKEGVGLKAYGSFREIIIANCGAAPAQLLRQILGPDAKGARQEYRRSLDCGSHLPLMPDQRGIHQIMEIPRLVEIQRLGLAFNLQHWIRFDLRAQILA